MIFKYNYICLHIFNFIYLVFSNLSITFVFFYLMVIGAFFCKCYINYPNFWNINIGLKIGKKNICNIIKKI